MGKKIISYGLSAIVLLSVFAMVVPASADIQMAGEFGVNDAMGNPGDYVEVPVNITNTMNGPIETIGFYIVYDKSVLNLTEERIKKGDLTSDWMLLPELGVDKDLIMLSGVFGGTQIANGTSGSVAVLNFSVIGAGGTNSNMNLSEIRMKNANEVEGTAPAKNGTFRVDAGAPSVTNPNANPDTIVADGVDETRLNVTVVDDIAVDVVVTVDLTQIGGPAEKIMEAIGGTLYSTTTNASIGTTPDTYDLPINATDLLGNYNNTEVFTLIVETPATGSINGKITYSCNTTGIAGVKVNLTDGSVVDSTITDANGDYEFTAVTPEDYDVNASKPKVEGVTGFWDNSTDVTVTAGATETVDMMLWLKGDLNNNGISADKEDTTLMFKAYLGYLTPDYRHDLNENGAYAGKEDVVLMLKAYLGYIVLT